MMLLTIIKMAKNMPLAIYYKDPKSRSWRYDFEKNDWGDVRLTAKNVIMVNDFIKHPIYKKIAGHTVMNFAVRPASDLKTFSDEDREKYPEVLTISIKQNPRATRKGTDMILAKG